MGWSLRGSDPVEPRLGALCLGLLCVMLGACEKDSTAALSRPVHVVLIVVDTLRFDHLRTYGYGRETSPSIDALAKRGVRFDRAYSSSSWTKPSVATILTGLYPDRHGMYRMLQRLRDDVATLPETLGAAGYRSGAVISHTLIGSKYHFEQGFDEFVESEALGHGHISTVNVTDQAIALLERLSEEGQPVFLFVHYFDPHDTYQPHAGIDYAADRAGRVRAGFRSERLRALDPPLSAEEVKLLRDLYDEEIRFTDEGIGRLLGAVESTLGLEQTLVILTSDHGEEFRERGWLGHGRSLYEEMIRVPLIVRFPGAEAAGSSFGQPVSLVSVKPTILDVAGVRASATYDGPSLRAVVRGQAMAVGPVYAELKPQVLGRDTDPWLTAVIDGQSKLIRDLRSDALALYDLEVDPGETSSRADDDPVRRDALSQRLTDREGGRRPSEGENAELDAGELEMLRQLGYEAER